ncbi:MAG TPA: hypothetical protein VMT34_18700, partial [Aggregatilineales bacterium]|nr:hypothetical protein [Aggregatilineales bacterium]
LRNLRPTWWLLVWVLLTTILGGVVLANPPLYYRYLVAFPALAIFVALGTLYLAEIWVWLRQRIRLGEQARLIWQLSVILMLALGVYHLKRYFVDYRLASPYFDEGFPTDHVSEMPAYNLTVIAQSVLPRLRGYKIWYFSYGATLNLSNSPVLRYLAPDEIGTEYTRNLDTLADEFRYEPWKQAFLIAPDYANKDRVLSQLAKVPALGHEIVVSPYSDRPIAYLLYTP